ncbi:laminin subunit beta-4 isoform X1 [Alligator mississippiensis]|uniref:laminin subunit beta-4 isoform X1 n=2 Tax=Alligator mississippiensis TaxID=8496 RepID=UPI00287764E1|nr:laminin subunit beta-4 isoform X1 [Alligator mississippiensis]XP_059581858.1 laminin subunit beta-4 isoform X1 [Alligator mississippiensis]XP_059581859.1 laminin subunit beta-4 isoform X1 [Alligator mississippiensis]
MFFELIIFLKLVLISLLYAQDDCSSGSCYPVIGDLLVGRSEQLTASSTCGMNGPQKYCIIGYLEGEQKCFLCDSKYPYNPYTQLDSHRIENVITTFEPDRKKKWWQSENGIDHVSIRLDLETLFQFSHLILTFKTFRPAAMLVERSTDSGQTWKAFRYFAQDCAAAFPNIPSGPARGVRDIVCDSRYSDIEPSTEGEVVLKALDPSFEIENPYVPYIQELITLTNLRINFTKLHTLGDTLLGRRQHDPLEKYYYAVYEMVVRGSCFCNGHASQCSPVQKLRGDVFHQPGMVHGRCICQHNTDGLSCERCKEFYNDAPWRPAEGSQDNSCKQCDCNGHSDRCHFEMAVYLANHGISGGVCDDCQHNTMGQHCDQCKPFFYQDPLRMISDPHACLPCDCDPEGTLYSGQCESHTDRTLGSLAGRCLCKENVEGVHCDKCKPNYYGLSSGNPLGCQSCNCNPFGSLSLSICDPVTGECLCQWFTTGRHCEECVVGYWGLGNSLYGCSPCDCDIGGAYNSLCSSNDGQCECLPNIVGRQCNEPSPGYFFVPLDYYTYEAEHAKALSGTAPLVKPTAFPRCDIYFQQQGYDFTIENGKIILNRSKKRSMRKVGLKRGSVQFGRNSILDIVFREPLPGKPVTWTGSGFARVSNGAGLRFTINNIPFTMDFDIAIRYEPESLEDWIASIAVNPHGTLANERCKNKPDPQEPYALALPARERIALLQTPFCLEPGAGYSVDVYFSQPSASDSKTKSAILIDSLGLIPRISSVENLCSKKDLDEYHRYHCIEIASEVGPHILPEVCARLIVSMSARIHNGAVPCRCHPQGSLSSNCSKLGGQCQCKPNVLGRCCDRCSVGSYGFGFRGCYPCQCHPQGSVSTLCDQVTGQCSCRPEVDGLRCSQCLPGYFGFPSCRPCSCNGYAELCDPVTGACLSCRGFTTGSSCERCIDGYYGNPLKRVPCCPCMCPDSPTSNRYFAHSCYQDSQTLQLVCNCLKGYSGNRCDECPSGFYLNARSPRTQCLPCSCNNNIEMTDPESCNKTTGECLKCLNNTHGPNCQFCKPGYFGSALIQSCRKCTCNLSGVSPAICPPENEACLCNPTTGACPCLPNVIGSLCDQCAPGYWNLGSRKGCQLCGCDPKNSQTNQCNQFTGQCLCKSGYRGRHCNECEENYFGNPQTHCISCKCNQEGTLNSCDKATGACSCRAGVTGRFCDQCGRGFKQEFPTCPRCHLCFDQWDHKITALSQAVQGLMKFAANLEDEKETMPSYDTHFKSYEVMISEIGRILKSPVSSLKMFLNIKDFYDYIRQKVTQVDLYHSVMNEFPDLSGNIEDIWKETDQLYAALQQKMRLYHSFNYLNLKESFTNIRKYYQTSSSAEEKISGITALIRDSRNTRDKVLAMLDDQASKKIYMLEQLKMIKTPDIHKFNEKICGLPGNLPCVIAACGGALCQDSYGNRQCGGPSCNGALPLSASAVKKAVETDMLLKTLTSWLQEPEKQIGSIRKMAEDTKLRSSQLHGKLKKAKNHIDMDREITKEFIRKVKDFLLDESASPEDIEKVANYVLHINLPRTAQQLANTLEKIRNLITHCENYEINLDKLNKQVEEAQTLLVEAKQAEEATKALPSSSEMLNNLKKAKNTQQQTKDIVNGLNGDLQGIGIKISQAENQVNKGNDELENLSEKKSQLDNEIATLQAKMVTNKDQAAEAKADAERAQETALDSDKEFTNLKRKYIILQEKLKRKGLPKETLEKLKQLKEEAEKLAEETEEKIKRITDLEKKLQDLNQTRQDKADQLKRLEDQVTAIKNEIMEQENKYATCKS